MVNSKPSWRRWGRAVIDGRLLEKKKHLDFKATLDYTAGPRDEQRRGVGLYRQCSFPGLASEARLSAWDALE